MRKRLKKSLAMMLVMFFICLTPTVSYAQNGEGDVNLTDLGRPEKVWNIASSGRYTFGGVCYNSTIYTNYKFKGKSSYTVHVENDGTEDLTIKVRTLAKVYKSITISEGSMTSFTVSGMDSSTEFYITFRGSSFDGYIQ